MSSYSSVRPFPTHPRPSLGRPCISSPGLYSARPRAVEMDVTVHRMLWVLTTLLCALGLSQEDR